MSTASRSHHWLWMTPHERLARVLHGCEWAGRAPKEQGASWPGRTGLVEGHVHRGRGGAFRVQATITRPKIVVTADGAGVVSHVGPRLLADVADRTLLTSELSQSL